MTWQPYTTCTVCVGGPKPGTQALLLYLLRRFPYTRSMGIYACRDIGGTGTKSQHACGRALDLGVPTNPDGSPRRDLGDPITVFLYDHSTFLGLTEDIYARVRYSAKYPRGAYYGGVHPHYDHHHTSQTAARAESLTYNEIVATLGDPGGDMPFLPVRYGHGYQSPPLDSGLIGDQRHKAEDVKVVQSILVRLGYAISRDGVYGPGTVAATKDALVNRAGRGEADGTAVGGIYHFDLLVLSLGGTPDLSDYATKAELSDHAGARPGDTIHPHKHDEGETGPAI